MNSNDDDVIRFLKIFTFLHKETVDELASVNMSNPGAREAHKVLAAEMTRLVHGSDGQKAAERITAALFKNSLRDLDESDFQQLALDGMATTHLTELSLVDALVETGLAITPKGEVTRGQARKLIQTNSISVNGLKEVDLNRELIRDQAFFGQYFVLQKGKKKHHLIVLK